MRGYSFRRKAFWNWGCCVWWFDARHVTRSGRLCPFWRGSCCSMRRISNLWWGACSSIRHDPVLIETTSFWHSGDHPVGCFVTWLRPGYVASQNRLLAYFGATHWPWNWPPTWWLRRRHIPWAWRRPSPVRCGYRGRWLTHVPRCRWLRSSH